MFQRKYALIAVAFLLALFILLRSSENVFDGQRLFKLIQRRPIQQKQNATKLIAYNNGPIIEGKPFDANLIHFIDEWKLTEQYSYEGTPIVPEDVVFVTYASSSHFAESKLFVVDFRKKLPNRIIYYDIGLMPNELDELKSVCNLELRNLNFSRFPVYAATLGHYRWKPIIMAEVFTEFPAYWIVDSSIRFIDTSAKMKSFYEKVQKGDVEPFVARKSAGHSIFATTHEGMYAYIPMDKGFAKKRGMADANTMFIWRSNFARDVIKWNVLCALTFECMAPTGAQLDCNFNADRFTYYAGCHRYDQSSVNIIISSMMERDGWKQIDFGKDDTMSSFAGIERGTEYHEKLNIPCRDLAVNMTRAIA